MNKTQAPFHMESAFQWQKADRHMGNEVSSRERSTRKKNKAGKW